MDDKLESYKENVEKAKHIVEELGLQEPYKTNAFNTILKDLLEKRTPLSQKKTTLNKRKAWSLEENNHPKFNFDEIPYFDNFDKLNWKYKL